MASFSTAIMDDAMAMWQPDGRPTQLWLDCDTGHDDAFAILVAAQCPAVRLLGISTVHGNAPLEHTTYNSRAVLQAIHRPDVPVHAGASKPICREPTFATSVHGQTGLRATPCLPKPSPAPPRQPPSSAVEAMSRTLGAQEPDTAYLVATGSLTNVALLFALHPDLADHIRGLAIMGGAIGGGFGDPLAKEAGSSEAMGNTTAWAEFNIYCDPEAAQAVFGNSRLAAKTTLIPLDLTHQMLATPDVMRFLRFGRGQADGDGKHAGQTSDVRRLFGEILSSFAESYARLYGLPGPPLHDPLAVAVCFAPAIFDDNAGERFAVHVVTDGAHPHSLDECAREDTSQCGRTVARLLPAGASGVCIPRTLHVPLMWRLIQLCLEMAEGMDSASPPLMPDRAK